MGPDARGLGRRHLLLVAHVARQLRLGVDVLAVHLPVLPASAALGGTLQRQLLRLITLAFCALLEGVSRSNPPVDIFFW